VPLKAIVEGETIIGPDLSEEEWTKLKSRHKKGLPIRMGCCGAPGHLRISKKGTQHFYHAVDTGCNYEEESREHLEIKYQIYRICKSENWETSVEFPASDRTWISDVYAIKDGRKIVFEIQISTISPNNLEERDKKYRNEGIESYWLLDNFLERSKAFESWYYAHLYEEDDRLRETIPYIDNSIFDTGPENHIFIAKGIRSVGLNAKNQTLFTTNNPEIPLAVWVREVLKGNYQNYLKETSVTYHHKRQTKILAAPLLIQFREFYQKIIRETYRKKVDSYYRIFKKDKTLREEKTLQKKFDEIYSETDWLGKEYHSCIAESNGLFRWKKIPEYDKPRPYFRLESELKIKKLQECVKMFNQWEASFNSAFSNLEREFLADKRRFEE
jgi:competence protein CoiA